MTALSPQAVAEMALLKAAETGDLATLERLVNQGVDVDATDGVRATFVPPCHPPACSVPPPPSPALARPPRPRPPSPAACRSACSLASVPSPPPSSPAATLATHALADPPHCMLPLTPCAWWVTRSARRRSCGHPSTATRRASIISSPRVQSTRRCTRDTYKACTSSRWRRVWLRAALECRSCFGLKPYLRVCVCVCYPVPSHTVQGILPGGCR